MILLHGLPEHIALSVPPDFTLVNVPTPDDLTCQLNSHLLEIDVVILGPDTQHPSRLVQRIHAVNRDITVLIVTEPSRRETVMRDVHFTPFIGSDVTWHAANTPETLGSVVLASTKRARARRRHQLTVARVGERLVPPPPLPVQQFLDHLLDLAPIGVAVVDEHARLQHFNAAAVCILNVPAADLLGRSIQEVLPNVGMQHITVVLGTQGDTSATEMELTRGAQVIRVKLSRIEPLQGRPNVMIILEDITEQRREAQRQAALYAITNELSHAHTQQEVVDVILGQALVVGHTDRGAVGLLMDDGAHLELVAERNYPPSLRARMARLPLTADLPGPFAARTGTPVFGSCEEFEDRFSQFRSFRPEDLGAMAALPLTIRGQTFGFLALLYLEARVFDEGERRFLTVLAEQCAQALDRARLYQQLQDSRLLLEERVQVRTAELRAANADLEAFAYSASHDLRTPVRHISSFAGLLRRTLIEGETERNVKHLDVIDGAAQRMSALVDNLLTFSRLGRRALQMEVVSLMEVVRNAREDLRLDWEDRAVEWCVQELPTVRGDAGLLRQVLVNLLSNALKYTRRKSVACIEVGAETLGDEVVLFVRDNGTGFDSRFQEKLFVPFQRLHRAEEFEGTGLGLANVKRIVQRHGGRVWAESQPGNGATFYIALPTSGGVHVSGMAAESAVGVEGLK